VNEDHPIVVTGVGSDRAGIVAGITEVLFHLGCNIQDASSTILRGHFAMMLVVTPTHGLTADALERRLANTAAGMGVIVTARAVQEAPVDVTPPTHMVSVYGADRPGIVYKVTKVLAELGANITDLTSRVTGSNEQPVYALMLEVELRDSSSVEPAQDALREELDVEISIHPIETDIF
jgi:glycine cleavage system transcriptional repressor